MALRKLPMWRKASPLEMFRQAPGEPSLDDIEPIGPDGDFAVEILMSMWQSRRSLHLYFLNFFQFHLWAHDLWLDTECAKLEVEMLKEPDWSVDLDEAVKHLKGPPNETGSI